MIVASRPNGARPTRTRRRLLTAVASTVVTLGVGLGASTPVLADVKAGVDAWGKGDFATAVHEWEGPAAKGDADAEFDLGQAYKLGRGVPQDLARAETLFGQSAAQGHLQAADNYGLLLFQRGDHTRAMPYVAGTANRGDPRAEYLLGIAYFNGDIVGKDWVRAYAFETLAQESGLQQSKVALAQMDKFIPLAQRQQAVAMKAELAQQIERNRNRQVAALELGTAPPPGAAGAISTSSSGSASGAGSANGAGTADPAPTRYYADSAGAPVAQPAPPPSYAPPAYTPPNPANPYSGFPATAPQAVMADGSTPPPPAYRASAPAYPAAQPRTVSLPPRPVDLPRKHPRPAPLAAGDAGSAPYSPAPLSAGQPQADTPAPGSAATPVKPAPATNAAPHATSGPWKLQLGAFGVAANADALWARVKARPEIAGHPRAMAPTGKVSRLLATGYSEPAARAACAKLTAAGLVCLVTKD